MSITDDILKAQLRREFEVARKATPEDALENAIDLCGSTYGVLLLIGKSGNHKVAVMSTAVEAVMPKLLREFADQIENNETLDERAADAVPRPDDTH